MQKFGLSILVFSLILAGCAAEPFKRGEHIQPEGAFYSRSYSQNGNKISLEDMMTHLKENPETRTSATAGQNWFYAGLLPAGVGGYLIGYNAVTDSKSRGTGILIGAGLVGLAFVAQYYSDKNMMEAVALYNRRIGKNSPPWFSIRPAFGVVRLQGESIMALPGVSVSF